MQPALSVSQNFLKSTHLVRKLIKKANIQAGDTVVDIGAGKGIISAELANVVGTQGKVIGMELDKTLFAQLEKQFSDQPQVEVVCADVLAFEFGEIGRYKVLANIPFSITSPLLEKLLTPDTGPLTAHLILQQNVLIGRDKKGRQTETFKSLLFAPFYDMTLTHTLSRSDFEPRPSVETALFGFTQRDTPLIKPSQFDLYKNFLAFVSRDRVGEGAWLKLFSKKQLKRLSAETELVLGRGLKSQSIEGIVAAFKLFSLSDKQKTVADAMSKLRLEQQRRERINQKDGHRRANVA